MFLFNQTHCERQEGIWQGALYHRDHIECNNKWEHLYFLRTW